MNDASKIKISNDEMKSHMNMTTKKASEQRPLLSLSYELENKFCLNID
jgi:hypothetical protein